MQAALCDNSNEGHGATLAHWTMPRDAIRNDDKWNSLMDFKLLWVLKRFNLEKRRCWEA